jgi:hypothetical protein
MVNIKRIVFTTIYIICVGIPVSAQNVDNSSDATKIALKTNMLFDAAITPNLEVETCIGKKKRMSIMAEIWFPWYKTSNNKKAYEVNMAGVETRYWMKQQDVSRPLLGHFVGLYAAVGKYDLESDAKGNQGEFYSAGITYGWTHKLSRKLNIELSVSAGIADGPYKHYEAKYEYQHLIYQYSKHWTYIGPTKAKVSLVWLLGKSKKGGNK